MKKEKKKKDIANKKIQQKRYCKKSKSKNDIAIKKILHTTNLQVLRIDCVTIR